MEREPVLAVICWIGAGVLGVIFSVNCVFAEKKQEQPKILIGITEKAPMKANYAKPVKVSVKPKTKIIRMKVTAYCADCKICNGKWADGRTALNDVARVCDGVAADSKLLKYRTKLYIPGIGIREVDDTGGAMRQSAKRGIYHIDVRMLTHSQAKKWGVKWLDVEVLQ